jgi:hypothetical protein
MRLPEIDRDCSAELQNRMGKLSKEAAAIAKEWKKLVADQKRFFDQDPAHFDPQSGRQLAENELRLLQRDLAIRDEVIAVDAAIRVEAANLARDAAKALTTAKAEVEKRLLSIGFAEPPPLSVPHHPAVIQAQKRLAELHRRANEKELLVFTREAQGLLRKALEAIKQRLSRI